MHFSSSPIVLATFRETTMSDRYLDDYLPVIAIDVAVEEKTRIAKMAATTVHKLHNVMQQMKDWRNDSARLKSNIWRMKMALRADDKDRSDNQQIDPLIAHQRAEISRLEQANDALENEVASLRRALTIAGEDIAHIADLEIGDKVVGIKDEFSSEKDEIPCPRKQSKESEEDQTCVALRQLRDKLKDLARGDRTIETILANAIGRVVETIVCLSEELVNVSEDLCRFKSKNRNLRVKLDRLRAMLRSRSGSSAEYRKRIDELNNLAEQLTGEMGRLKVIRENASRNESLDTDIPDVVKHVERLMNDLRNNLKSDREAMIAAGDPEYLKYMKRVVDLKVNLKVLSVELRQSNVSQREESRDGSQCERYLKAVLLLNDFLKEVDVEIGRIKVKPMDKYCRIGGVNASQYMTKVIEVESIVKKSATMIAVLKQNPLEIAFTERTTGELEDLIEQLCRKIRDLEIFDDRSNLRERIEQLETSVVRLRLELVEKNDRISELNDEHASVRLTSESDRNKYEKMVGDMRLENENLLANVRRGKQEILELMREHEHCEQRAAEMQLMKVEIDAVRKKLQDLHDDKETLLGETEKMRNILCERDKEIENIITRRDALKGVFRTEVKDLKMKLGIASDENVKLKGIIEGLGKREERERLDKLKSSGRKSDEEGRDNGERSRGGALNLRDELERLKAKSNESKISLSEAEKRIGSLKCALDEAVGDRARLQDEISGLKSNEESLMHRLYVQANASEETSRELERVMAENKTSENKVKHLQNEKEQLEAELSELRSEKGLLDRSMADANNKCAALQDQVNKFKSERNGLWEKISEHEAAAGNLKFELEKARAEHEDAVVKTARLESKNSALAGDLDVLSSRNTELEDRVRVLLTEKNELTTRINELNDENVGLRDQLNKAKAENEYFSMELNKSRVENDEAKAKNALLQVTCDKRGRDNEELRRERDDTKRRLNEIGGECRTLDDRLKVQRTKYEALRIAAAALYRENNDRKSYLSKIDRQYRLARDHGRGLADAHNKVRHKQDCSDAAQTSIKVGIGEQKDDETEFKAESDTCTGHDNKAKIKDKPKGELKRLRTENKALKREPANLRSDVAIEPTRTKDEFESSLAWAKGPNDEEFAGAVSKKIKTIDICCGKETSDCFTDGSKMREDKERPLLVHIDRLRAENSALKMEVDILRSGLDFNLLDDERTNADFGRATEEIQALKLELTNLRDEKVALRSQLEMFKEELNELRSERAALKDELVASRKSNFDFRLRANDLRNANEKLKETNVRLESRLQDALRETNEYAAVSAASNRSPGSNVGSALKDGPKECAFVKEHPWTIKKRLNRFECSSVKNSRPQPVEENLRHMEGQK